MLFRGRYPKDVRLLDAKGRKDLDKRITHDGDRETRQGRQTHKNVFVKTHATLGLRLGGALSKSSRLNVLGAAGELPPAESCG